VLEKKKKKTGVTEEEGEGAQAQRFLRSRNNGCDLKKKNVTAVAEVRGAAGVPKGNVEIKTIRASSRNRSAGSVPLHYGFAL